MLKAVLCFLGNLPASELLVLTFRNVNRSIFTGVKRRNSETPAPKLRRQEITQKTQYDLVSVCSSDCVLDYGLCSNRDDISLIFPCIFALCTSYGKVPLIPFPNRNVKQFM